MDFLTKTVEAPQWIFLMFGIIGVLGIHANIRAIIYKLRAIKRERRILKHQCPECGKPLRLRQDMYEDGTYARSVSEHCPDGCV